MVLEYPFKQNRSMLKNMTLLLYTYFFNMSLNVLRPTFFNICTLPFLPSPNIGKIRVKVGPKTNYFSYFMSVCTNRIALFNNFFHWYVANQETSKTMPAIFLCAKFKIDRLRCFHTGARQLFITQKPFPSEFILTIKTATSNSL